jgi:hypothetical protein
MEENNMAAFTIFHNEKTGAYAAVYDFNLPTQTGIGARPEWKPVQHGQATDRWDMTRQKREYEEARTK